MLPPLILSGSSCAQSLAHAQLLRRAVRHTLSPSFHHFALELGLPDDEVLRQAERYSRALEALHLACLVGMQGITEGTVGSSEVRRSLRGGVGA